MRLWVAGGCVSSHVMSCGDKRCHVVLSSINQLFAVSISCCHCQSVVHSVNQLLALSISCSQCQSVVRSVNQLFAASCHAMSCRVVSCQAIICCMRLCCVVSCQVMSLHLLVPVPIACADLVGWRKVVDLLGSPIHAVPVRPASTRVLTCPPSVLNACAHLICSNLCSTQLLTTGLTSVLKQMLTGRSCCRSKVLVTYSR